VALDLTVLVRASARKMPACQLAPTLLTKELNHDKNLPHLHDITSYLWASWFYGVRCCLLMKRMSVHLDVSTLNNCEAPVWNLVKTMRAFSYSGFGPIGQPFSVERLFLFLGCAIGSRPDWFTSSWLGQAMVQKFAVKVVISLAMFWWSSKGRTARFFW